jgi:hypothetical protein
MYVPVFLLNHLASEKPQGKYDPPGDFVERTRRFDGCVSLGYDVWDRIRSLFSSYSTYAEGHEFDMLYLNDDYERDALRECREELAGLSRDNPDRRVWLDTKRALLQMRAQRLGLGLDGVDWNIG